MLRLTVINSLENTAQRVLISRFYREGEFYPALDRNGIHVSDDKFVHFIIVGMSPIGYAMAVTAAHVCHFPNFHSRGLRTKITFIQTGIRQEMNFFLGRYDSLMKLSYGNMSILRILPSIFLPIRMPGTHLRQPMAKGFSI